MAADAIDEGTSKPGSEREHEGEQLEGEQLYGVLVSHSLGQTVLHGSRAEYLALTQALHADGFLMCIDLTAVDYLTHLQRSLPDGVEPERFEVVVSFINHRSGSRLRVRVQVPEDDPELPTLFDLYPGTEALEREVFDMFGITFVGHPDMTRILMPEDWVGHPLRKDFSSGRIPVQFKAVPVAGGDR